MKKTMLTVGILLLAASAFAEIPGQRLSLAFGGGWGLYCGGDYNDAANGYNSYIDDNYPGGPGRYKKFNTGFNAELEGVWWFKPNMGVGLGVGRYGSAISDNLVDFEGGIFNYSYDITTSVNVTPIMLNYHYRMPLCTTSFLEMYIGAGLYFGAFNFTKNYEFPIFDEMGTYDFKGHTTRLGFQGGVNANMPIIKDKLWFFAGVQGRTTSLKNFADEWTDAGRNFMGSYSEGGNDGQFFVFDAKSGMQSYRLFEFNNQEPSGTGVSNVKKGSVGGGSLQIEIGLKAGF